MKDTKSLLLVMLSAGLTGTWIYHLYDKTRYSNRRTEVYIKDSVAVAQGISDSLQKLYSVAITNLDTQLDSTRATAGQLKGELNTKLAEIYRLRTEIATILKKNNIKREDIDLARKKTAELQFLVTDLQNKNSTIEEEKKQITDVLDKVNVQVKSLETNVQQLDKENKALTEKVNLAAVFVASEIKFVPVTVKNDKEVETNLVRKATKFVISFTLQNNVNDYENAEVYIVVTQPDGKVLRNDIWESSSIDTYNGGRKSYSLKMRFEYHKGEPKPLLFSMNPDEFMKGTYTLQVYHNGHMIGQVMKTLQ
jgi:myosin heavy subunit